VKHTRARLRERRKQDFGPQRRVLQLAKAHALFEDVRVTTITDCIPLEIVAVHVLQSAPLPVTDGGGGRRGCDVAATRHCTTRQERRVTTDGQRCILPLAGESSRCTSRDAAGACASKALQYAFLSKVVNPWASDSRGEQHMSMTAGEGEGGAGIMDDASCSSEAEAITAAAARDCAGSLVERCAGDGDCSCGGVNPGWGVEWSELSERPL
jgi:hypothetical protein